MQSYILYSSGTPKSWWLLGWPLGIQRWSRSQLLLTWNFMFDISRLAGINPQST